MHLSKEASNTYSIEEDGKKSLIDHLRVSEPIIDEGEGLYRGLFYPEIHFGLTRLAMLENGHQLCGVSLEGERIKQIDLPVSDSKILIDLFPLKDDEGFLDLEWFVEAPLADIVNQD